MVFTSGRSVKGLDCLFVYKRWCLETPGDSAVYVVLEYDNETVKSTSKFLEMVTDSDWS